MPSKNSGGSTKFPGGHKVIHRTAQTAFVRVVTPRVVQNRVGYTDMIHASWPQGESGNIKRISDADK